MDRNTSNTAVFRNNDAACANNGMQYVFELLAISEQKKETFYAEREQIASQSGRGVFTKSAKKLKLALYDLSHDNGTYDRDTALSCVQGTVFNMTCQALSAQRKRSFGPEEEAESASSALLGQAREIFKSIPELHRKTLSQRMITTAADGCSDDFISTLRTVIEEDKSPAARRVGSTPAKQMVHT